MIIVKVMGGLGNQMFQVAFAKMLSIEYGEEIYLDISAYENYKIRKFSLSNLVISNSVKYLEKDEFSKVRWHFLKSSQKVYRVYQKVMKEIFGIDRFGELPFKLLSKKGLFYNFDRYYYENPMNNPNLKCIYGYFQSERYFEKYKNEIIDEFKVEIPPNEKEENLLAEIYSNNAVGVSMRLGDDYVKSPSLNVCKDEFYYKAMDEIYKHNNNVVFYIFSDSIERAKSQFDFKYPVRYIEGFKDYESLRLLYTCKHFIISNSSFSWWGAYLSTNTNKIVIAPDRWYNDSKVKPDIYLDDMTLLEVL
ncbi:alpha-1,2-fucosyltransferase [Paenibacillus odorifer]|uniref:alpha-1,2-fucosyltransferase n=1 Tax=Paenibacillus odorifer TaxID=189426 RepID=UPI002DB8C7D0|nr:alpha-1,2-fucosyltransferase [Paenibacillus odorifer]MEC0132118.1 alpha-1,2-fucosyltransferase [Paenibacillus odorifer]MEC0220190.1 alpha-1,2-fucosyltransferase [Paenibacillus odorifer]